MRFFVDAINGLNSLIFPPQCPHCGSRETSACRDCLSQWERNPETRFVEGVPIHSTHPYDDSAMRVVVAAKERGEREARRLIIHSLLDLVRRLERVSPGKLVLVPIPATPSALRRRGEDVIFQLSKSVAAKSAAEISVLPLLTWNRSVKDQSSLSMRERRRNLSLAMTVDPFSLAKLDANSPLPEIVPAIVPKIVIVDDVLTTGATMTAAISAISHSPLGRASVLAGITACYSVNPIFV